MADFENCGTEGYGSSDPDFWKQIGDALTRGGLPQALTSEDRIGNLLKPDDEITTILLDPDSKYIIRKPDGTIEGGVK